MANIEKERKKIELLRVQAAKAEMSLAIMLAEEEIQRLHKNIEVQSIKETELTEFINKGDLLNG